MVDTNNVSNELSVNTAVNELLTPQQEAEKVTPEVVDNTEPQEEEALVSETEEPEEIEEDNSEEGDEVEDTTGQEDDIEEVEEEVQLYKVKIDGEEAEVTLDEALSGYQREQTFHKRMNKLSQDRKSFEAEQNQTKQLRDQYAMALQQMQSQLQVEEPNWDELRKTKTAEEFSLIHSDWSIKQDHLRKIKDQQQAIQQQQQQEAQEQFQNHLKHEFDIMLDKIPTWRDEKVRTKERADVVSYAKSMGYSDEEIGQASDHRAIVTLRKAMLWDNLKDKTLSAKKKVKTAPRMVKSGVPKTKAEVVSRKNKELKSKFYKDGSINSAVELLMKQS